jgi:uncharacterized protein (TIGR02271 family)
MSSLLNALTGKNHGSSASHSSSSYSSSSSSSTGTGATASKLVNDYAAHGHASNSAYGSSSAGAYQSGSAAAMSTTRDDAMTRSEERLLVGKEQVEAGRAGLHKYVTTEHVATAVPLTRERVVVEREAIDESNIDKAMAGPDIKEAEYEVALREERAVAQKETIPVERVRMKKVQEQTQDYVEADLRKEHIEVTDTTGTVSTAEKTLDDATRTRATSTRSHAATRS